VSVDHDLVFDVEVEQSAAVTATGVTLTVTLPPELDYVSAVGAGCSDAGGTVVCDVGDVPPGVVSLQLLTRPLVAGELETVFQVDAAECDRDVSDNVRGESTAAVDADPCDADGDGQPTNADLEAAVAYLFTPEGFVLLGNPDCSESSGVDAEDLARILEWVVSASRDAVTQSAPVMTIEPIDLGGQLIPTSQRRPGSRR
jgi:hypothetical protein